MAAYSEAYSSLVIRLKEIESILSMARANETRSLRRDSRLRVDSLCRSGVVLLCSHIEGYVENVGALAVERIGLKRISKGKMPAAFRYHLSRDLILGVKQSNEPEIIATRIDELMARDADVWNTTSHLSSPLSSEIFIGNFSTPKHDSISSFFGRFGYSDFHRDLLRRLTTQGPACTNMIDQVVDQRNKIAHGDQVTTGTPHELEDMLRLVKAYCKALDQVVGDWFRSIGCPIR